MSEGEPPVGPIEPADKSRLNTEFPNKQLPGQEKKPRRKKDPGPNVIYTPGDPEDPNANIASAYKPPLNFPKPEVNRGEK